MAYSLVLGILVIAEIFLFMGRTEVEVLLLRTPGMLYQEQDDGQISNLYNYQLINKTDEEYPIEFIIENLEGASIEFVGQPPSTKAQQVTEGALFIKIPRTSLKGRKNKVEIGAYNDGRLVTSFETNFLGPVN